MGTGWCHPEISLQELLKLIKGFIDILILASGYQSSGHFANWDPLNIKKAFQWALFFENVFKGMDGNQDSMDELDTVLSELKSDPHFPQGLTHISLATLSNARIFIMEHLIRTLPMRDTHLKAVLKATIEMDLDELQREEANYLDVYLEKLTLEKRSQVSIEQGIMDFSPISCPNDILHLKGKIDLTEIAIRGVTKRQLAVSCASVMETSVDVVAKSTTQGNWCEFHEDLLQEQQNHSTAFVWNNWRTRTLSYLLDKRTIRLVSGANMIFSAPKVQWARVFERLDMSKEANDNVCEIIELLLLGCISSRWDCVIHRFVSNSHGSFSISTIYEGVHNLILERFQNVEFMEETKNSKEQDIVEYLEVKLSNQIHRLWELSPALTAASLPTWSRLFEVYSSELLSQFKGKTTKIRCCSCIDDNKEHTECLIRKHLPTAYPGEVAERIWCLYIFHVLKIQS